MTTQAIEADTRELVEELRRGVAGEVRFDKMTRMLYSTDASIYQIEPVGVVLPKSADDVIAVLETAHQATACRYCHAAAGRASPARRWRTP